MLLQTADGYKSHTVLSPTYHNPFRTYNSVERIVESKPLFDNKKDVSATALCSHRTVSGKPTSLWGLTDEHGTTFNRLKSKLLAKASGQAELNFPGWEELFKVYKNTYNSTASVSYEKLEEIVKGKTYDEFIASLD
jgi:hypothetical protein